MTRPRRVGRCEIPEAFFQGPMKSLKLLQHLQWNGIGRGECHHRQQLDPAPIRGRMRMQVPKGL